MEENFNKIFLEILEEIKSLQEKQLQNNREDDFDNAFELLIKNEGVYSNLAKDPGKRTIFGISEKHHPNDFQKVYQMYIEGNYRIALLLAKIFYKKNFWDDRYKQIKDSSLAFKLFDTSVNLGKKTAIRLLQRVLRYTYNLEQDDRGVFDQQTLDNINLVISRFGADNLYENFIEVTKNYYKSLKNFIHFGKGWLSRLFRRHKI